VTRNPLRQQPREAGLAPAPASVNDYAWLFTSNVLGIFATGIATVALALLAFHLAGDDSGIVLGTALSLKMAVNIIVPPVATIHAAEIPRLPWLMFLNLMRVSVLGLLPFVTEVYHVYLLIVVFESAAAAFRATYLATVPDMLPDDRQYAGAVAKARIAYNAETMLSPLIAAALLFVIDYRGIFVAAAGVFLLSSAALARVAIPKGRLVRSGTLRRMTLKFRRLFYSRVFRGAFAINAAATMIMAMVAVNTVVLVRGIFELDDRAAAIALATFGAGGILGSVASPRLITRYGERAVELRAGTVMAVLLMMGALLQSYGTMLVLWGALGVATTLCQLPIETILRRMTESGDRQIIYTAHYMVSSALLLASYLAAGWVGAEVGMVVAFISLGLFSALMMSVAWVLWPQDEGAKPAS